MGDAEDPLPESPAEAPEPGAHRPETWKEAFEESFPLLLVGGALLASAYFAATDFGSAAPGHLPVWTLFLGLGVIASGGGIASLFAASDEEPGPLEAWEETPSPGTVESPGLSAPEEPELPYLESAEDHERDRVAGAPVVPRTPYTDLPPLPSERRSGAGFAPIGPIDRMPPAPSRRAAPDPEEVEHILDEIERIRRELGRRRTSGMGRPRGVKTDADSHGA